MRKGLLGKVSLFSVILLAIALILIFVLPVFSIPFISYVSPTDVSASAPNQILNFTIINADATGNITQVNIILPSGFYFITGSNATTAGNTLFSNTSNVISWSNITGAGFVVSGGGTQYFSMSVSVPSVASAAYNFNVSTLDTTGAYNSTNVTVTVNDTSFPTWSGQLNVTPSYSTPSQFNITWSDNVGVSTVLIEGNWSNSNASMTSTYGGGIYNYSAVLPAGVWQWKTYASDTKGNINASSPVIIYISQATPVMTLTNSTVTYPASTTINGNVVTGDAAGKYVISLYRNNSLVNSSTSASSTYETNTLGIGLWNYTLVYNGTQNYSSASITNFTLVSQGSTLSGSITGSDVTYPDPVNVQPSKTNTGDADVNYTFWRNTTLISSSLGSAPSADTSILTAGTYVYILNSTSGANWTSNSSIATKTVNVNKNSSNPVQLTINNGTDAYYDQNVSITYGTSINASCFNVYNCTGSCSLYRDGVSVGANNENVTLGAGTHSYTINTSGNENYSANTSGETFYVIVGKKTLSLSLSVPNVTYPSNTVATVSETNTGDADVNYTLYRNNTGLVNFSITYGTAPEGETVLLVPGDYLYVLNTSAGSFANYTANTTGISTAVTVNKGALSGSISGSGVTYPTSVSVTPSESNTGDADVNYTFWRNGALISSAWGNSSISADTSQISAATYTYLLNSSGGANWTANPSIYTLTITVSAASSSLNTGGSSSIGGITSTGMITYINLAVGKANITANYLTTSGKLIANIARYQDVAFRGMNVTVVNNVVNIKIMISKLQSLPSSVSYDINGKVYNYISVGEQNFTDADIKLVNIYFAVNKTWLTNNNVDASNITLYRWANNKWNDLSAVKVSDNGNEVFFTASSPGLSIFVIGTKGGAPVMTETPTTCTESWSCNDWSTCANNQQTRTCTDANSCGTTTSKPSESQSCTVSTAATTVPSAAPVQTSILTTVIVIVIAIIVCVFIFLQRDKISSYLVTVTKKNGNHKKTSYLETLTRKAKPVEEVEEEKFNVNVE